MPELTTDISQSLLDAIDDLSRRTGDSRSEIVSHALADALGVDHASLFQVSAAGALVAGVTRGSISVAELTTHGDFGLGTFDHVKTRAVCKAETDNLVAAAHAQATFEFEDPTGVVAGVWSPRFTNWVTVADWHLHFLTDDHQGGGHVLDCHGSGLEAQVQRVADFHVAFPETVAFMQADLATDHRHALDEAETDD